MLPDKSIAEAERESDQPASLTFPAAAGPDGRNFRIHRPRRVSRSIRALYAGIVVIMACFAVNAGYILAFVVAALATWAGVRGLENRSVRATNEGRGIEAVAQYLKTASGPNDAVISSIESNGPLRYYLQVHGVPASRLAAAAKNHAFVVVNETTHESLPQVLRDNHLNIGALSSARMLARYDTVELYEIPLYGGLPQ